jgi:hypothetical protein
MRIVKRFLAISFSILVLTPANIHAQDPYLDHATGIQCGYARFGYNQIELGLNHYWSYARHFTYGDSSLTRSHTFGPFACATFVFKEKSGLYVAPKFGFNYAFPNMLSFRISPSIEYIPHHEWYAGFDVGGSLLGVFLFYGYYISLSDTELPGYSNNRFGIKIILNEAPFNTSGVEMD